jgi:hypothetical protein
MATAGANNLMSSLMERLDAIQTSLNGIIETLGEIKLTTNQHDYRITSLEKHCEEAKKEHDEVKKELRVISNNCIERADIWKWGRDLRASGKGDPENFWNKLVTNGTLMIVGPTIGCVVAFFIGKILK